MSRVRNKFLPIRLKDDEYKRAMKKLNEGKKKGLYKTYAEYIMDILDKSKIEVYEINLQTWDKELKAIGNNINQWTKGVNTFNEVSKEDVIKLEGEIKKIWQLLRSLKNEIMEHMEGIHLKMK